VAAITVADQAAHPTLSDAEGIKDFLCMQEFSRVCMGTDGGIWILL
jgi:hypothetical protein